MKIVYQTATRIIADYIWEGKTPEAQVLQNVINSQLGGSVEDYSVVDAPPLESGNKYVINSDGTVGQELSISVNARLVELETKLVDDSITFTEMKELMRLRG
jgi:hypothetical protein